MSLQPSRPLVLPSPGSPSHYPHADELAARPCVFCQQPIGYDRSFWFVAEQGKELMHDSCHRAQFLPIPKPSSNQHVAYRHPRRRGA
jgi:hypothetical protein